MTKSALLSLLRALPVALGCVAPLAAQDAEFIGVIKTQNFIQDDPLIVALLPEDFTSPCEAPFQFEALADASSPNLLTGGSVQPPVGTLRTMVVEDAREVLYIGGFEVFSDMQTDFGDGSYTVNLNGVNDGTKSVSVNLSGNTYAGVTRYANFTAAQTINPVANFTVQWDPIPGLTGGEFVILMVDDEFQNEVFSTPDVGEPGALTGASTSAIIPAGTLGAGQIYFVTLEVFKIIDANEDYAPDVAALSGYGTTLTMEARTIGITDPFAPSLLASHPLIFQSDIPRSAVVTFVFSEAMDTGVDVGQAISWSGLDSALMTYTWSANGETLFCDFPGDLPASTAITWRLNAPGASAMLQDLAGNDLADTGVRQFTTAADATIDPDARRVEIGKGRSFLQDGPIPTDLGSYFAGFFVEMTGISTVLSVDLGIPGRGTQPDLGEHMFDFTEIGGEAPYFQKSDLDRFFPNGTYTVTLHSSNDGVRSLSLPIGPADAYPNAPTIQNFATTQAIDSSQPFTLEWDAFGGGTSSDLIEVVIESDSACFFETGALDGTATSVSIPAGTLPPGRTLSGELVFAKVSGTDSSSYPGVIGVGGFLAITKFEITTIGDPFRPVLGIVSDGPRFRVSLTGERGRRYQVRRSPDLDPASWSPLITTTPFSQPDGFRATFEFIDNGGTPARFFQARDVGIGP